VANEIRVKAMSSGIWAFVGVMYNLR